MSCRTGASGTAANRRRWRRPKSAATSSGPRTSDTDDSRTYHTLDGRTIELPDDMTAAEAHKLEMDGVAAKRHLGQGPPPKPVPDVRKPAEKKATKTVKPPPKGAAGPTRKARDRSPVGGRQSPADAVDEQGRAVPGGQGRPRPGARRRQDRQSQPAPADPRQCRPEGAPGRKGRRHPRERRPVEEQLRPGRRRRRQAAARARREQGQGRADGIAGAECSARPSRTSTTSSAT